MTPGEQARADSLADAATLRWATVGVSGGPLVEASLIGGQAARAVTQIDAGYDGGNYNPEQAGIWARRAARAAFRAVPGLRVLALALLLVPAAAQAGTLDALVVGTAAADCATTEWALSRPGTRELNPMLQGPAQRVALKSVATVAILGATHQLDRHGHKGWAKAIKILAIVGWGGAAINNAVQARRAR